MTQTAPARPLALPIALVIACAIAGAMLAMGLRQSFGLFLAPMTTEHGWAARDFAFAIGLQVLINGISQPFMGQLADRFGGRRVVMGGAVFYCIAILGMALSESVLPFTFFAGLILGMAVSAAGMPTIIASLTRMLPPEMRGRATGLGT
ncbi:MAG: MFS transporter, partial [Alphaproteobacteria bacterium]